MVASAKQYVYTDISVRNALYLLIDGKQYEVAQYTASWAANEIPTAVCMLAVGRNARTNVAAQIHSNSDFAQMAEAEVWFTPRGEYSQKAKWPDTKQLIFRGFLTGFAPRKINGKIQVTADLIHWSAALGFSSSLTALGHVSNHSRLNSAAVLQSLDATGAGPGNYISQLAASSALLTDVTADLWASVKNLFCKLAQVKTVSIGNGKCGGLGEPRNNEAALAALNKIEGEAIACKTAYKYGVPLKLDTQGVSTVANGIAVAIGHQTVQSYSSSTFWDKLVGEFCPMFGMAFVPMVDSAIVIADTPAYSGGVWKTIDDEYDSFEWSSMLHRPIRAVGVIASYAAKTKAGEAKNPDDGFPLLGGCYVEDSVRAGDGLILYVEAPPWLKMMPYLGPTTSGKEINKLYERYAQLVFASHMLRGRGGNFSGKLRFDVAPGSIIQINPTTSSLLNNQALTAVAGGAAGTFAGDQLAVPMIGCVSRVTVSINSESAMAGTTFVMSHLRRTSENGKPRTSVSEHPLFGKAIHGSGKHGCPLQPAFDL